MRTGSAIAKSRTCSLGKGVEILGSLVMALRVAPARRMWPAPFARLTVTLLLSMECHPNSRLSRSHHLEVSNIPESSAFAGQLNKPHGVGRHGSVFNRMNHLCDCCVH